MKTLSGVNGFAKSPRTLVSTDTVVGPKYAQLVPGKIHPSVDGVVCRQRQREPADADGRAGSRRSATTLGDSQMVLEGERRGRHRRWEHANDHHNSEESSQGSHGGSTLFLYA